MKKVKNNIQKFNSYVDVRLLILRQHQQPIADQDLISHLFKGYLSCLDKNFVASMETQKDTWALNNSNLTSEQLMKAALIKYETRQLENQWLKRSHDEQDIIALRAQVIQLTKSNKSTTTSPRNTRSSTQTNSSTSPPRRLGIKNKVWTGDSKWRGVAPAPGAPTTKVVKGKTWHFCKFHNCKISSLLTIATDRVTHRSSRR
jgi:hypothetical protein